MALAVGEETVATAADEVSHRTELQCQAACLVEVCLSEVMDKLPEVNTTRVSTSMVKPTVVKVVRATTRAVPQLWSGSRTASVPRVQQELQQVPRVGTFCQMLSE